MGSLRVLVGVSVGAVCLCGLYRCVWVHVVIFAVFLGDVKLPYLYRSNGRRCLVAPVFNVYHPQRDGEYYFLDQYPLNLVRGERLLDF